MADHCNYCDTRRPEGGTNILMLGTDWHEVAQHYIDEESQEAR